MRPFAQRGLPVLRSHRTFREQFCPVRLAVLRLSRAFDFVLNCIPLVVVFAAKLLECAVVRGIG
jgi:hypothetical protein